MSPTRSLFEIDLQDVEGEADTVALVWRARDILRNAERADECGNPSLRAVYGAAAFTAGLLERLSDAAERLDEVRYVEREGLERPDVLGDSSPECWIVFHAGKKRGGIRAVTALKHSFEDPVPPGRAADPRLDEVITADVVARYVTEREAAQRAEHDAHHAYLATPKGQEWLTAAIGEGKRRFRDRQVYWVHPAAVCSECCEDAFLAYGHARREAVKQAVAELEAAGLCLDPRCGRPLDAVLQSCGHRVHGECTEPDVDPQPQNA